MDMQNVDYEMRYEPGKDEADPLDFLSRHPLPEMGEDETEEIIKSVTEAEPAIVLDKIKTATARDSTLQNKLYRQATGCHTRKTLTFHPSFLSKMSCTKRNVSFTE